MKRNIVLSLLFFLWLSSCKKEEIVVVPDNQAPPDSTIEIITIENYINRSYIGLVGRKPDSTEYLSAYSTLTAANFSEASRKAVLDDILASPDYNMNLFMQAKSRYLNGVDTADIQEQVFIFNLLLQDPQYAPFYPVIQAEIGRLELVLDIPDDLLSESLDVKGMHRRMVYNYVYDQINMGSQNFVISLFQHFLFRYPTDQELLQGQNMVDGIPAVFFLTQGQTKTDFLDIFFASTDYAEGQVRDIFLRFLYREPSATEADELASAYESSGDYRELLKSVLSTDEYAGI